MKSAGKSDNGSQHRAKQKTKLLFHRGPMHRVLAVCACCGLGLGVWTVNHIVPLRSIVKGCRGCSCRSAGARLRESMQCAGAPSEPAGRQAMRSRSVLGLGATSPSHVAPASFSLRRSSSLESQNIPCKGSKTEAEGPDRRRPAISASPAPGCKRKSLSFQIPASLAISCISHQRKRGSSFRSPVLSTSIHAIRKMSPGKSQGQEAWGLTSL